MNDKGSMPKNTYLEVTTAIGCKVNCKMCPQKLLVERYNKIYPRQPKAMTLENFSRCIDNVPHEVDIRFCGMSEPFQNKNCTEMILYAHERGHKIGLLSTLSGITKTDIDKMSGIKFDIVRLHLPDKAMNAKINASVDYLENLRLFLSTMKVENQFSLNIYGQRQLAFETHGEINDEVNIILQEFGYKAVKPAYFDRAGNLKHPDAPVVPFIGGSIYCVAAGRALNRSILLPNGAIVLCCMDYGLKHVLGNLLENTYEEILNGETAQSIRSAFDDDKQDLLCRICNRARRTEEN